MDDLERTDVDLGDGVRAVVVTVDPQDDDLPVKYRLDHLEHDCVDAPATWPISDESHQASFHQGLLMIRPGLSCDLCGRHGQVTDGVWEPIE